MPRATYAARTLADQVTAARSRAKVKNTNPDGLNVYRSMSFDKPTSKWLHPLLEAIEDPRITALDFEDGVLTVTFSAGTDADTRDQFPLDSVSDILNGE